MVKFFLFSFFIFSFFLSSSQTSVKSILTVGNSVFAGTNFGVFIDSSGTFEWKKLNSGLPDGGEMTILHEFNNSIYGFVTNTGLFSISKNDTIWKKISSLPVSFIRVNSIYSFDSVLYVIDLFQGIASTSDNGKSWKFFGPANQLDRITEKKDEENEGKKKKHREVEDVAKKNEHKTKTTDMITIGNLLLAGVWPLTPGCGIYSSENNGKSWSETGFDLPKISIKKLVKSGKIIYAVASGFNCQIFRSENNGSSWELLAKPSIRWVTLFCASDKALFAGNNRDGLCVSYDQGLHWELIESLVPDSDFTIESIAVSDTNIYVGTSDGIRLLTKINRKWEISKVGLKTKSDGNYFYADIGSNNGVTLSASKYAGLIIFKAKNTTDKTMKVNIQLIFECKNEGEYVQTEIPKTKMDWLITVEPHSEKSFDSDPTSCSVSACKDKTNKWEITGWKVSE